MDRKKNLETCLVIVTGLLIIYLIKDWQPLLIAAAVVGFTGVFLDKPASWITWLWYKLADILGKIVPRIILSVIFFLFLFPVSLLYRTTAGDKMALKNGKRNSMWRERNYEYCRRDLQKPW